MLSDPWLDSEWDRCAELKLWTQVWPVQGTGSCPQGDVASTGERYEHVTGDGRVAKCFEFQVGSTARSIVEASANLGYGYLGCNVAVPTVPPLVSVQEPVFSLLPAAQSRYIQDWTLGRFESPWNPSRRGKWSSMPGWPLSVLVMAGALTMTTTTITSSVLMPEASAGPVYLHIPVKHHCRDRFWPISCNQLQGHSTL